MFNYLSDIQYLKEELRHKQEHFLLIYNELIDLKKSNISIEHQYNLIFGEVFVRRLDALINTEKLMRKIELIESCLNKDEVIDLEKLEDKVELEFKDHHNEIDEWINKINKGIDYFFSERLNDEESTELKIIYLKIAKNIQPDINGNYIEAKKDLWQKTLTAYENDDLESIKECEHFYDHFIVPNFENSIEHETSDKLNQIIERLDKKIEINQKIINKLRKNFPYNQKDLIFNDDLIMKKVKEIEAEIDYSITRAKDLELKLDNITMEL